MVQQPLLQEKGVVTMRGAIRVALVLALVTVGFMVTASTAQAVVLNLTSDHCTGGCGAAGTIFGTVTLVQNGTTVDVTVHLNTGFAFANTGAVDNQAFKFNGATSGVTVNQTVPGQTLAFDTGAFNGDGTGTFTSGIACTTCGGGLSSAFTNDIVFHVANATIAQLTVPNAAGNTFVADIGNLATGNTGPVDCCGQNVPEPTTLALLGTGLVGLGFAARRRWIGGR
jgi:PEP-CTERM motif